MANNKRPLHKMDRNMIAGPWTPLQQVQLPEEAKKAGVIVGFQNNRYTVFVKEQVSDAFGQPGPDGKMLPMKVAHLIINRNDRKQDMPWADKQRIKNEILGPMVEAVELCPAEWRRMPGINENQTHLWAFPPGVVFPLGLMPLATKALADAEKQAQEHVLTREDVQVFVVKIGERPQDIEVFADNLEANEMYEKNGKGTPEGAVQNIGDIPTEHDGAAWSERAKAKIAQIMRKAEKVRAITDAASAQMPDQGDSSIVTGDPKTLEEMMRAGIAQKQEARDEAIKEAQAVAKEVNPEEEAAAAAELAKMRDEMLKAKA